MNKPEYVKVDGILYKINTDFRIAIECNKIAKDTTIGDYERVMAIIYKLFGEKGLDCQNQAKLIELAMQYISLGNSPKSLKNDSREDYELDINKCEGLISSSFVYDYKYDPYELEYLHWYKFYNDLENLSTSGFGDGCALNRVINTLSQDPKEYQDSKDRQKLIDAQNYLREKYCIIKEKERTKEQEESAKAFIQALNIN